MSAHPELPEPLRSQIAAMMAQRDLETERARAIPHDYRHRRTMSNAIELAGWLTAYADYRAEYLHGFDPQTADDLAKASEHELLIWAEIEGVRKAAKLITDPANNYMGLPSWRWDDWLATTGNPPPELT